MKNKMAKLSASIAIIKLNVNGLNPPIKDIDFHCRFKKVWLSYIMPIKTHSIIGNKLKVKGRQKEIRSSYINIR